MDSCFQHIPLGSSLPLGNPHAVSVSFPKLQDVIGYEENNPDTISQLKNGYPRFFKNHLVEKLEKEIRKEFDLNEKKIIFPITSLKAKEILENIFNEKFDYVEFEDVCFLLFNKGHAHLEQIQKMIQHVGAIISSRQAEKLLFERGILTHLFEEEKSKANHPEQEIKNILAEAYTAEKDHIFLTNTGTNAVYSAIEALSQIQKKEGKTLNVQLGWLYLDTIEIIQKRSDESFVFVNIHQKEQFENWLAENHKKVANIIAETVSNPLLQCLDVVWLSALCQKYQIGLILDNTMATAYCAEVLPYCDVVVESLTKFACGHGDVMMGALIIHSNSVYKDALIEKVQDTILPSYEEDCKRLAFEIQDYASRMQKISENTSALFDYLKNQDFIGKIHSVYEEDSWQNFQKIRKNNHHIGLLSIEFKKPFEDSYNTLNFAKGPSLGTEFTLAMPYTYLAHYHLLQNEAGRDYLKEIGLPKDLLRVSVGTEPIECIIAELEKLK